MAVEVVVVKEVVQARQVWARVPGLGQHRKYTDLLDNSVVGHYSLTGTTNPILLERLNDMTGQL